ncbi:MAG: FtsX-like permease family protein [Gemmataceae bacterium]
MRRFLDVAWTGVDAVRLYPLRSGVSVLAVLVVLVPYLVGLSLAKGLEEEIHASLQYGADAYVTGRQLGRPVPLPLVLKKTLQSLEGVVAVTPRIVAEIQPGKERLPAVLVGMDPERFPAQAECIDGRLPEEGDVHQLVVGSGLARRLGLHVESVLPPFYRNNRGERLSRVVGVFSEQSPPWQTNLVLTTFATAAHMMDQPGYATDFLVWCRPGYEAALGAQLARIAAKPPAGFSGPIRLHVTTRQEWLTKLPGGVRWREGVFTLHLVLAFIVAILVLLVTSGMGLQERRREVAILKATGWQTDEVLLRGAAESLCLSLAGASGALLLAWAWLRVGNGVFLAEHFLPGADTTTRLPYRLTPVPALLGFVLAFVIVTTGTLWSAWRAAATPPHEILR